MVFNLYEGSIYRPPSEARSLIVQATIGCSHNKCTFCTMYKDKSFRIKTREEIARDLQIFRNSYSYVERIFLADGDALLMRTDQLVDVLDEIKKLFPEVRRIGIYGRASNAILKSVEELKRLKDHGLGIVYIGIESGSDKVLDIVKKGINAENSIIAGQRIKEAGLQLSCMIISGLGGEKYLEEHAKESARVISAIKPDYLSLLTLLQDESSELYQDILNGDFRILSPEEVLYETKIFLENLELEGTVFRCNHPSNYVVLNGTLNEDKERLINTIDSALETKKFRPENWRAF